MEGAPLCLGLSCHDCGWQDVQIPLSSMWPTWRGRVVGSTWPQPVDVCTLRASKRSLSVGWNGWKWVNLKPDWPKNLSLDPHKIKSNQLREKGSVSDRNSFCSTGYFSKSCIYTWTLFFRGRVLERIYRLQSHNPRCLTFSPMKT